MTGLDRSLRTIAADLRSLHASFALVGGLAVSAWVEPRFTRDADLAISVVDDSEAEALVASLRSNGYAVLATVEQEAVGRLATVRLEGSRSIIDLLFASSGIEPEIVAAATPIEIVSGLTIPVATIGHLIAMKLLSVDVERRPVDGADLVQLADVASDGDWKAVDDACGLIVERGFARGRDLEVAAMRLRRQAGQQ